MNMHLKSNYPFRRDQEDKKPARIVLLLEELNFGGTQRQTLELALNLNPTLFHPEIWLMAAGADMKPLARGKVPIVHLSRRSWVGPESFVNLWQCLRSNTVDMLVLLTVIPNIWGRLLGRLAGVPIIVGTSRGDNSAFRQHEKLLRKLADHHICNADALKRQLSSVYKIPDKQITVIPNGVNTEFFKTPEAGSPAGRKVVICVARLVPEKDHETLISAFGLLAPRHPDAQLWIVGNGPSRKAILDHAARRSLEGMIRLLPGQLDLRPLFSQSSLLVLSSVEGEGLPNVVLEAMASGLPVVATDGGGLPEVVDHDRTGLLVPSRNPAALADAMSRMLGDADAREAFGREGRKRAVDRYSIPVMVRRHEEIFQELLENNS